LRLPYVISIDFWQYKVEVEHVSPPGLLCSSAVSGYVRTREWRCARHSGRVSGSAHHRRFRHPHPALTRFETPAGELL